MGDVEMAPQETTPLGSDTSEEQIRSPPSAEGESEHRREVDSLKARVAELEAKIVKLESLVRSRGDLSEISDKDKISPRSPQSLQPSRVGSPPQVAKSTYSLKSELNTQDDDISHSSLATREVLEALIDQVPVDEVEEGSKTPQHHSQASQSPQPFTSPPPSAPHQHSSPQGRSSGGSTSAAEMIAQQVLIEFSCFGSPSGANRVSLKRPRPDAVAAALSALPDPQFPGLKRQRRGKLPEGATNTLKEWLFAHLGHPYPSEEEKTSLSEATLLSMAQINNWFTNARRRILPRERDQQTESQQAAAAAAAASAALQQSLSSTTLPPPPIFVQSLQDAQHAIAQAQAAAQVQAHDASVSSAQEAASILAARALGLPTSGSQLFQHASALSSPGSAMASQSGSAPSSGPPSPSDGSPRSSQSRKSQRDRVAKMPVDV